MTTNYRSTFIAVAPDCPAAAAEVPPVGATPSVAALQYELLRDRPYELTSDEILFSVHAARVGIDDAERAAAWERFFAKDQACLRASPLSKRYGWGFHHDAEGRVALVGLGTPDYDALAARDDLSQKAAMRSSRR
ncbi:MAG: DUF6157 family protein [Actinomycetota bacterium]